jgi:hypothetical protein
MRPVNSTTAGAGAHYFVLLLGLLPCAIGSPKFRAVCKAGEPRQLLPHPLLLLLLLLCQMPPAAEQCSDASWRCKA